MMSFETNPYSWKDDNITGTVGSVSLTRLNGSVIPVENLPEEIEVTFAPEKLPVTFLLGELADCFEQYLLLLFRSSYRGLMSGRRTAQSWTLPILAH